MHYLAISNGSQSPARFLIPWWCNTLAAMNVNRTVSVQGNQVIKVAHNGRLWGGRNILFYILIKSSPEIPRFVNIKIQVEVEVEVDCELGDIFFLALPPPKVDHSLQLLSLKQLERTSSWVS